MNVGDRLTPATVRDFAPFIPFAARRHHRGDR